MSKYWNARPLYFDVASFPETSVPTSRKGVGSKETGLFINAVMVT